MAIKLKMKLVDQTIAPVCLFLLYFVLRNVILPSLRFCENFLELKTLVKAIVDVRKSKVQMCVVILPNLRF